MHWRCVHLLPQQCTAKVPHYTELYLSPLVSATFLSSSVQAVWRLASGRVSLETTLSRRPSCVCVDVGQVACMASSWIWNTARVAHLHPQQFLLLSTPSREVQIPHDVRHISSGSRPLKELLQGTTYTQCDVPTNGILWQYIVVPVNKGCYSLSAAIADIFWPSTS